MSEDSSIKEMIVGELNFANERLNAARVLLERNMLVDAVNRAYYAIFYAARAMLNVLGYDAKTHSGIVSEFGLRIVKEKLVPEKYAQILRRAFELRETSDYVIGAVFGREEVDELIKNVSDFVEMAEKFVNERL